MVREQEGCIEQLTVEVESISDVKQQLQQSNTQLQMNVDQLHSQLSDAQTRSQLVSLCYDCS